MSFKFRLAYNEGFDYTDLFPKTNVKAIEGNEDILKYSEINLTIPVTTELEQTIPLTLTSNQQNSPFFIELQNVNEDTLTDYYTINQAQIVDNNLILIRLDNLPKNSIDVKIRFKEIGV